MHALGSSGQAEALIAPEKARPITSPTRDPAQCLVEELLPLTPLADKVSRLRVSGAIALDLDYAIAIPARDEEALLPRSLAAIEHAMDRAEGPAGGLVLVVNDSSDGSARLASRWAGERGIICLVVEGDFAADVCDAPHARRLALDLAARLAPAGALFTSDADSRVGPDWIVHGLACLARGVDLVCEDVRLDETEQLKLHERVRLVGMVERAYFEAIEQLWRAWTSEGAGRFAYRASGASLAMSTSAYLAAGRLPLPESGEDRALCEAMLRKGLSVEMNPEGATRTSARLVGRAAGGCASALVDRAHQPDPMCDPALVPVQALRELAAAAVRNLDAARARQMPAQAMRFTQVMRELAIAIDLLEARK